MGTDDLTLKKTRKTSRIPMEDRKELFLKYYERGNTVTYSAKQAQISMAALYNHRKNDADFAQKWERAEQIGGVALEDEAWRRAVDGVEEPQTYQGQITHYTTRYSDTLLMFLLKARFPEKYARPQVIQEQTVPIQFNIGIERDDNQNRLHAHTNTEEIPLLKQ